MRAVSYATAEEDAKYSELYRRGYGVGPSSGKA